MNRFLSHAAALQLLRHLQAASVPVVYEPEKHRLLLPEKDSEEQVYFRLPLTVFFPGAGLPAVEEQVNYVILLIQSGNCALGYFENGINLDHKVFRSYMVRKKQGKSQIKYLKTKGKSRAGSRVRLGETVEFFENINERLQAYFQEHEIHRIALSCSKILIPYLFGSKVVTPFAKNDPRVFKIPKHIHTPIYQILLDANRFLQRGELRYEEAQQSMIEGLLRAAGAVLEEVEEEEDDLAEEDLAD
ncbi:hypothetical protein [Pontibacter liquoris]|uniref:hypothetical protein n=1 Tax=Pontibacter liquoris TaxID=2905677 RepID=UPI001FA6F8DA|nr:hypothetical protein [Pontibacter liquoris]